MKRDRPGGLSYYGLNMYISIRARGARTMLLSCAILVASVSVAKGQLPYKEPGAGNHAAPPAREVKLNVTAFDAAGHPVKDLTGADLQICDEGKLKSPGAFRASGAEPVTTLILWDLMNSVPGHREYTSKLLIRALEPLAAGDSVA